MTSPDAVPPLSKVPGYLPPPPTDEGEPVALSPDGTPAPVSGWRHSFVAGVLVASLFMLAVVLLLVAVL